MYQKKGNTMNARVIAYENPTQGVYKYAIIKNEKTEISELQRFIKSKKIDLDIKVEVKEITIPEKGIVGPTTCHEKEHEVIVLLQGPKNGAIVFCDYPVIEHTLTGFLDWLVNWKGYNLDEISDISFYTKGLRETLEITPCAWGCDDSQAFLDIKEK